MKIYVTSIRPHGASAQTCGSICGGPVAGLPVHQVEARDAAEAARFLRLLVFPADSRPLACTSYLRAFRPKVGQRVGIMGGYPSGCDADGKPVLAVYGTITEIVTPSYVSVHPDGYHNRFVDFTAREVVLMK